MRVYRAESGLPSAPIFRVMQDATGTVFVGTERGVYRMQGERFVAQSPLLPEDGYQVWNSKEVIAVMDRHSCVKAYFNGHNHAGAQVIRGGIPYITFKSVLHEPGVNSYSAIRLFTDRLEIEGNGREQTRTVLLGKV